ncbi:MAG: hypothetical protein QM820_43290 [Minicystis sp.]
MPIADCVPILDESLKECLTALDAMFARPEAKVFVHCLAGQNRSPTIAWLYLVRLGWEELAAREQIADRAADAVPAHPHLITPELVSLAKSWGRPRE